MSKTPPATTKKTTVEFKIGDVVLAKVRGYQAWPSVIVDGTNVPANVKNEKPKGNQHYCIRFMPTGEFGWPTRKDVILLTPEKINGFLEKDKKKNAKLTEAYEKAKDPTKWITDREEENLKQIELEANAQEDQLDEEDEGDKKKSKKAKKVAEPKPSKKKAKEEEGSGSKKSRPPRKRAAGNLSDDEKPKKKQKKDKEEDEDNELANDPEAVRIKDWRHQLQRAFLRDNIKPEASTLQEYNGTFTQIEQYPNLTIQYLSYSKIGKVMKKISQLDDDHIPEKDAEFNFRERALKLVNQWQQILNTRSSEVDGPTVNGTGENAESAAEGDAPAPEAEAEAEAATTAEGEAPMVTDA